VLEIGCGGAVAAIAAAVAGAAAVEANDVDRVALQLAARNAAANGAAIRLTATDYGDRPAALDADVVLIADLFYEQAVSERLLSGLRGLRRRGAEVFVADAGRPFAPRADVVLLREETVAVDHDLEGVASRRVRLLSLG
jgi:predicted nicotinamide N-methyase